MKHWQWGRELIFWGSVVLNAVLAVLLFFKSAINEIVRDWWTGRRQHREQEQERLHELRRHLVIYPSYHFSLMIQMILSNKIQSDHELQQILRAVESVGRRLSEAGEFIATNEPRFPPEIQEGLRELKQVSLIHDVLADSSRIFSRHDRVVEVCGRLVAQIDSLLMRDVRS